MPVTLNLLLPTPLFSLPHMQTTLICFLPAKSKPKVDHLVLKRICVCIKLEVAPEMGYWLKAHTQHCRLHQSLTPQYQWQHRGGGITGVGITPSDFTLCKRCRRDFKGTTVVQLSYTGTSFSEAT